MKSWAAIAKSELSGKLHQLEELMDVLPGVSFNAIKSDEQDKINVGATMVRVACSVDSEVFAVRDGTLESFFETVMQSSKSVSWCDSLVDVFGVQHLFATPFDSFCLEVVGKDGFWCVFNDSSEKHDVVSLVITFISFNRATRKWGVDPAVCIVSYENGTVGFRVLVISQVLNTPENIAVIEESRGISNAAAGEVAMQRVLTFLAMLNTKGATTSRAIEQDEKLARANKKRGKTVPAKITEITFVGREPTHDSVDTVAAGGCKSAHLVRGHFKRRKTGTFWWKPHVAGSGELRTREAYAIR